MRVPARVWTDEDLWQQIRRDRTLWQLVNVATLPGIVGQAQAMPDALEGYGFPVGWVAAFRAADGVISHVVHRAGLAHRVARLTPLGVVKG